MKVHVGSRPKLMLPRILRRTARDIFWGNPFLYKLIAAVLGRPFLQHATADYDLWVGGFPRSSNTYTARMLELCLTHQRLLYHIHFPAHIIPMVKSGKPGMFVLREPAGACISWAQYADQDLADSLDFYIDFHRIMRPYAKRLFIAPFESTTSDFSLVIEHFNRRYALSLTVPEHSQERMTAAIERNWKNQDGSVQEMRVARPSAIRNSQREKYRIELNDRPAVRTKLKAANSLYEAFMENAVIRRG